MNIGEYWYKFNYDSDYMSHNNIASINTKEHRRLLLPSPQFRLNKLFSNLSAHIYNFSEFKWKLSIIISVQVDLSANYIKLHAQAHTHAHTVWLDLDTLLAVFDLKCCNEIVLEQFWVMHGDDIPLGNVM